LRQQLLQACCTIAGMGPLDGCTGPLPRDAPFPPVHAPPPSQPAARPHAGAIVCTYEKASQLVNQLLQECKDNGSSPADYLSTLVVDEVHMVGEPDR
jgi:hypothetical protein